MKCSSHCVAGCCRWPWIPQCNANWFASDKVRASNPNPSLIAVAGPGKSPATAMHFLSLKEAVHSMGIQTPTCHRQNFHPPVHRKTVCVRVRTGNRDPSEKHVKLHQRPSSPWPSPKAPTGSIYLVLLRGCSGGIRPGKSPALPERADSPRKVPSWLPSSQWSPKPKNRK